MSAVPLTLTQHAIDQAGKLLLIDLNVYTAEIEHQLRSGTAKEFGHSTGRTARYLMFLSNFSPMVMVSIDKRRQRVLSVDAVANETHPKAQL
jgi:hypothetical protein